MLYSPQCNMLYSPQYNMLYSPHYNMLYSPQYNMLYSPQYNMLYSPQYNLAKKPGITPVPPCAVDHNRPPSVNWDLVSVLSNIPQSVQKLFRSTLAFSLGTFHWTLLAVLYRTQVNIFEANCETSMSVNSIVRTGKVCVISVQTLSGKT
jgi:hypothetical protein